VVEVEARSICGDRDLVSEMRDEVKIKSFVSSKGTIAQGFRPAKRGNESFVGKTGFLQDTRELHKFHLSIGMHADFQGIIAQNLVTFRPRGSSASKTLGPRNGLGVSRDRAQNERHDP
jgi:hypothetical protein